MPPGACLDIDGKIISFIPIGKCSAIHINCTHNLQKHTEWPRQKDKSQNYKVFVNEKTTILDQNRVIIELIEKIWGCDAVESLHFDTRSNNAATKRQ